MTDLISRKELQKDIKSQVEFLETSNGGYYNAYHIDNQIENALAVEQSATIAQLQVYNAKMREALHWLLGAIDESAAEHHEDKVAEYRKLIAPNLITS